MPRIFCLLVILSAFSSINSIRIGKIENNIIIGITNNSLINLTRDQCICEMIESNELIFAVNYFQLNQTCQLFSTNITSILIQFNLNSSFIFLNQSTISIKMNQSNSKINFLN